MPRRDILVLIGLFAALATLIGLGPGQNNDRLGNNPSSHVSGPGGALALYRWLEGLGYDVWRMEYSDFSIEPYNDLLIILGPVEQITREEATAIKDWVGAGGTLLVVEERTGKVVPASRLLAAFDLSIAAAADGELKRVAPVLQPALGEPAVRQIDPRSRSQIVAGAEAVPLAGSATAPVLVGQRYGEGYIFVSSALYPFTNEGLRNEQHAAMVLNLLRRVPEGGVIVFDEIHHGFVGEASLRTLLLGNPWGWATLYAGLVGVAYLGLTGRRFGRAMPLRAETDRRSSAEYLASMAGLLRRAGKREYLLSHYRSNFKRRLARRYGLSLDLDDPALVAAIAQEHPQEAQRIAALLTRMAGPPPDEEGMLKLVSAADRLLEL